MRAIYADEAPVPEIKGGLVVLNFKSGNHLPIAVPIHVALEFCETTLLAIGEHQRKPSNVRKLPRRRRPAH